MSETFLNLVCNRLKYGACNSGDCLTRGNYKRGDSVNYDLATCEALEINKALAILRRIVASADDPDSFMRKSDGVVVIPAALIQEVWELMK